MSGSDDFDDLFNELDFMGAIPPQRPSAALMDIDDPYAAEYEDLLFDEYDSLPSLPDLKSDSTHSNSTTSKYLASEVCGKKFLCRRGDRGPCQRNEVFTPVPATGSKRPGSCSNLISYPWNGCLPASKVGVASSAPTGCCSLRSQQRPCFGYPPTYRYCRQTKRCYPCANDWNGAWGTNLLLGSGPCAANKIFTDVDGVNGMCRCRDRNQLLYKSDDKCHRIYSKGPCKTGEWLEAEVNGYGICRRSPCTSDKCDGRHIYWRQQPGMKGGCYKSFTRGPCHRGSYFLIDDYATRKGRCVTKYGSSFNPMMMMPSMGGRRYPARRNTYSRANRGMSPWANFGPYPTFGIMDYGLGEDYDDLSWDF